MFLPAFFASCASDRFVKWQESETQFYRGNPATALNSMRELANDSSKKDRLLYLMEAGTILHSMGAYDKSSKAFEEADTLAENIKKSISLEALSFILSDNEKNYVGENFERVLIKFYLALNSISLGDQEAALRYFKQLDFDLKEMKYTDEKYKQNLAARYLTAILSEATGNYNDARVQYNNIMIIDPTNSEIYSDRYILAMKEKDMEDIQKYQNYSNRVDAFNSKMEHIPYNTNMGELVVIHQAGKAPEKKSRGPLLDDETFMASLRVAIEVALVAKGAALSTTAVIAMMTRAENPIPIYIPRDQNASKEISIELNGTFAEKTKIYNDYSATAIDNFNANYSALIAKNVSSMAMKLVVAAITADELSKKLEKSTESDSVIASLGRIALGASAGKIVADSIKPDLRCWRLLPSNFQIRRIFLEPGEYSVNFDLLNNAIVTSPIPSKIMIQPKSVAFIDFRSMPKN